MIVTKRTKASLTQFLDLFSQDVVHVLLEKYGVSIWGYNQIEINNALSEADQKSMESLIEEVVITKGDLRNRVNPRYRFDERWNDLEKCLLLDGYRVEGSNVVRIEPECVILCRAVIDTAFKDRITPEICEKHFGKPRHKYDFSLSDRIQVALNEEIIDEDIAKKARTVKTRGDTAVHKQPNITKDVWGTICDTVAVLKRIT